jgi:hypothetical protein
MGPRELAIRLLVVWGVGAAAGGLLLFLAGIVVLILALAPPGHAPLLVVWAAYAGLALTALLVAIGAAIALWDSEPTAALARLPRGLVAVPGAVLAILVVRPVLSPGLVLGVPALVEAMAAAAVAVAVVPAVAATIAWARARRGGPTPPRLA